MSAALDTLAPVHRSAAGDHGNAEQPRQRIAKLEELNRSLRRDLLHARARAGELDAPPRIATELDAEVWLAWARANHHQVGCLCHRCPAARALAGPTVT